MQANKKLKRPEPERAANQDFAAEVYSAGRSQSGWDPHEVWRRMIKEPRDRRARAEA